jgi:hypothetical protein
MEALILLLIIGAVVFYYFYTQSSDLSDSEISRLASIRRDKAVNAFYSFDQSEYGVNQQFKKNMSARGAFYETYIPLPRFPGTAAALLKYKKHEWCILAFERDGVVDKIWLNKGPDGNRVWLNLDLHWLCEEVEKQGYNTVLHFHNHPNSNPSHYSANQPSEADLKWGDSFTQLLLPLDVNYLAFVCERGRHYEYYRSVRNSFMPVEKYLVGAQADANKKTRLNNYRLRREIARRGN